MIWTFLILAGAQHALDPDERDQCFGTSWKIRAGMTLVSDPFASYGQDLILAYRSDCRLPCIDAEYDRAAIPDYLSGSHFRLTLFSAGIIVRPIAKFFANHSSDCQTETETFGHWHTIVIAAGDGDFQLAFDARYQFKDWAVKRHFSRK